MATTEETRKRLELQLARTYRMLFHYETLADDLAHPPAWLCTIGQLDCQLDCRLEIALLEADIAKVGFPSGFGIESH